jgi:hypothetical protein
VDSISVDEAWGWDSVDGEGEGLHITLALIARDTEAPRPRAHSTVVNTAALMHLPDHTVAHS